MGKEDKDKYTYRNPVDRGYKQFKLSKKQHNYLFPKRKKKWNARYEYYYSDERVIMQQLSSYSAIVLTTVLFPVLILFAGLSNFKEAITEMKWLFNEKKYGKFSEDWINRYIHQEGSRIESKRFSNIMFVIKGDKQ
ncbi:hypothetical protein [Paenibacillus sp. USHLN196]|uniref:hypothetical protein n=1 Tax=Paenibacillus sp. USHLN196 TaxID=3081291 RepID=UPI0030159D7C